MNSPLARWEAMLRLGVMDHPDFIHRTAGYVTRMSGGVGGGGREAPPIPIRRTELSPCGKAPLSDRGQALLPEEGT